MPIAYQQVCDTANTLGLRTLFISYNYPEDTSVILKQLLAVSDMDVIYPVAIAFGVPNGKRDIEPSQAKFL